MKLRNTNKAGERIQLQMTSMIDIVFLLLIFFIMTFQIVLPESDFNIQKPLAVSQGSGIGDAPPIRIRMAAAADGTLAELKINDINLKGVDELRSFVVRLLGDDRSPGSIADTAEIEFDCDDRLNYEHVIDAIDAVSGMRDDAGNTIKLIDKIRFAR